MKLIAIDPGVRVAGRSTFQVEGGAGALMQADLIETGYEDEPVVDVDCLAWTTMADRLLLPYALNPAGLRSPPSKVLVEFPQKVYQGSKQKGDPEDLLRLAALVGVICAKAHAMGLEVEVVKPRTWKDQIDKLQTVERVWDRLSDSEKKNVRVPEKHKKDLDLASRTPSHNVFDSVGLGLWYFGRFKKKRVYPR